MDLATLLGLMAAMLVVVTVIVMGGVETVGLFINAHAGLIVLGGSFSALLMQFSLKQFLGAVNVALKAFIHKGEDPHEIIKLTVDLANTARKGGLLALEDKNTGMPFYQMGIQMMVDGHEPDVVRHMMTSEMNLTVERHERGQKIFKSLELLAPAMGMVGTLIGLVQMFSHMSDPKSIGPAMAVALLATFYGAVTANLFAGPIANKLGLRSNEERLVKSMIIDAIAGIQEGRNPRVIEGMLLTYLPGSQRKKNDADQGRKE